MNFYYFGTHYVVYNIIYEHPEVWPNVQDKWFYDISMGGFAEYDGQGNRIKLIHSANINYKVRHIVAQNNDFPKHM